MAGGWGGVSGRRRGTSHHSCEGESGMRHRSLCRAVGFPAGPPAPSRLLAPPLVLHSPREGGVCLLPRCVVGRRSQSAYHHTIPNLFQVRKTCGHVRRERHTCMWSPSRVTASLQVTNCSVFYAKGTEANRPQVWVYCWCTAIPGRAATSVRDESRGDTDAASWVTPAPRCLA